MNIKNNTIIGRIFLGLCLCAIVLFMFTSTGKDLLERGSKLLSPAVAQSAIMPLDEENASSIYRDALAAEIYLPQEVDLNAGSDFIPVQEEGSKIESNDIAAMLNGAGRQCDFRNHVAGTLALNNCGSI